jgi:hypothetical protein
VGKRHDHPLAVGKHVELLDGHHLGIGGGAVGFPRCSECSLFATNRQKLLLSFNRLLQPQGPPPAKTIRTGPPSAGAHTIAATVRARRQAAGAG